jgi:hypothetical protein
MAIIDPQGLFNGDRLLRCSNAAQFRDSDSKINKNERRRGQRRL